MKPLANVISLVVTSEVPCEDGWGHQHSAITICQRCLGQIQKVHNLRIEKKYQ